MNHRSLLPRAGSVAASIAVCALLASCQDANGPADPPALESLGPSSTGTVAERCTRGGHAPAIAALRGPSSVIPTAGAGARVNGGGQARVTDVDGLEFPAAFGVSAGVNAKGAPHGSINFMFGPDFSAVWAADPAVIGIHVWGKVMSVEETAGAIQLTGQATEVDVLPGGKNIIFENEPFWLTVTGPRAFTFTWCALPDFDFEVTGGGFTYGG